MLVAGFSTGQPRHTASRLPRVSSTWLDPMSRSPPDFLVPGATLATVGLRVVGAQLVSGSLQHFLNGHISQ